MSRTQGGSGTLVEEIEVEARTIKPLYAGLFRFAGGSLRRQFRFPLGDQIRQRQEPAQAMVVEEGMLREKRDEKQASARDRMAGLEGTNQGARRHAPTWRDATPQVKSSGVLYPRGACALEAADALPAGPTATASSSLPLSLRAILTYLLGRTRTLAGLVLVYCFMMSLVAVGLYQTFSVYLLPIAHGLHLERAAVASIGSLTLLVSGLCAPLSGYLFDRIGPRGSYLAGTTLVAAGFFLASQAAQLWHLWVGLGLLLGMGVSLSGGIPATALVSRWFLTNTGAAMGLIFSAGGVGSFFLVPLAQLLIGEHGWRFGYQTFSLIVLALIPVVLLMPWARVAPGHPDRFRLTYTPSDEPVDVTTWTFNAAVGTASFWGLFLVYFFTGASTVGFAIHMVSYLISAGIAPVPASIAFGLSGLLAPIGMIGFGHLADTVGRAHSVALSYVLTLLGLAAFYVLKHHPSELILGFAILCFGLSSGSRGPVVSSLCMHIFGGARLGGIYGTISLGGGLGSAVGVLVGGILQDLSGGTDALIAFTFAAAILGSLPFWTITTLKRS